MKKYILALIALIINIALASSVLAETPYPSGSIASSLVDAQRKLTHSATRAAGITALGTQLTAIEALDNTTTIPVFELVGIVTYLGSCRDIVDANGTSATTKRVDAAIVSVKAIIAYKRANSGITIGDGSHQFAYERLGGGNSAALLTSLALGSYVIGRPKPAYGKAAAKADSKPDPKPDAITQPVPPLHGDPSVANADHGKAPEARDESELGTDALNTSAKIETAGAPASSELLDLLARADKVRDGSELAREDIVALRISLQRFRSHSDDLASKVDEETNRLEAVILGLPVKKGTSITGQTRNR